jgi:hypothetical protein
MELTVSFDDNDSISQDWFTPDWLWLSEVEMMRWLNFVLALSLFS